MLNFIGRTRIKFHLSNQYSTVNEVGEGQIVTVRNGSDEMFLYKNAFKFVTTSIN